MENENRIKLIIGFQEIIDRQATNASNIERDHKDADELLLDYINDKEISQMYDVIDRWYA